MTLFERVKNLSKKRGLSISEVERRAGLSENYLYTWKKSENPRRSSLTAVAKVLGVSVDFLLTGEDSEKDGLQKVNIEKLLDGTAMLTDRDGELTDSDRAALRALISTYLQSIEGRERLKKYSNMELDDNGGNGDD
ncbi:helix-turn-helix domain-containing protein [Levilactobacillus brevis]|uniref:helix-turn-helix domain-containing protein n=1 Tax=Levilactobacillus brevis TaxID=1580 RepID=UPI000572EC89|nr:helix-turn-helix transcriptional regulator [Levilactobacillus brevis]AJA79394.1 XRE family transcriptional regulator [Levilactobacillus brevis BSO 464]QCZ48057.1 Transcriptional regulator xre family [Levilactobacillus brevis]